MNDAPGWMEEMMEAGADEIAASADTRPLEELGREALRLERELNAKEEEVKEAKKKLDHMLIRVIPQAMDVAAVSEFGFDTEDGKRARMQVKVDFVGSLTAAKDEDAAVAYLEENGFAGGVLTSLELRFLENEREIAEMLEDDLLKRTGKEVYVARKINPSTLKAFVRGAVQKDPGFNYEIVGMTALRKASFTKRS